MCSVSVILPSLNVAKYIKQCIESVINQTLTDIEIISVDAGSTDGTAEILKEYAAKDPRIILLRSDVKSYGHQMNLGIKKATGDYIGIVETDDYVETDMFEKLYAVAKLHDAEIVKCQHYVKYEYNNFASIEMFGDYIGSSGIENTLQNPNNNEDLMLINNNIWNGLYKRSFLLKNGVKLNETQGAAYQDIGFHHQVFNNAHRVVYTKNCLYHYRVFREGSSSCNEKILKNVYQEYKWLYDTGKLQLNRKNVVVRMISDTLGEYKRVLQYYDFKKSCMYLEEILAWFRTIFFSLDCYKYFAGKNLERDLYLFLLNNGWFEKDFICKVNVIRNWLDTFQDNASKNGVVIFGTGNYGAFLSSFLIRNGLPPVAYVDNNEKLWGTALNLPVKDSLVINSPQSVLEKFKKSTYLIASRYYGEEIKKQLLSVGIERANIIIYDGSDSLLRDSISTVPYISK